MAAIRRVREEKKNWKGSLDCVVGRKEERERDAAAGERRRR